MNRLIQQIFNHNIGWLIHTVNQLSEKKSPNSISYESISRYVLHFVFKSMHYEYIGLLTNTAKLLKITCLDQRFASILEKRPAMRSENRLFLTYPLHFYSRDSLPKQQSAEKDKRHHGQWIVRRLRLSLILFPRFHLALVVPHDH